MQADEGGVIEPAPAHDVPVQEERPADSPEEQDCNPLPEQGTFEQRFEQFYLQLSEVKTGGMVVSEHYSCSVCDDCWSNCGLFSPGRVPWEQICSFAVNLWTYRMWCVVLLLAVLVQAT